MPLLDRRSFLYGATVAFSWGSLLPGRLSARINTPNSPTLYLLGDETVHNTTPGQKGWGDVFDKLWDVSRVTVVNRATAGATLRSWWREGSGWASVQKALKPGDYVLIALGPRDNSHETVRPVSGYLTQLIRGAKAQGAIPIVLSPVPRSRWRNTPQGKKIIERTTADVSKEAKEAAVREGVPFIDLNALLVEQYDYLGPETVQARYFGPTDSLHTNAAGAAFNASFVLGGMRKIPSLEPLVLLSKPGSL